MNVAELKAKYYVNNPKGHYFDKEMMKYFGERESRMYVLKRQKEVTDIKCRKITCWVLSKETRLSSGRKERTYDYFSVKTGNLVYSTPE